MMSRTRLVLRSSCTNHSMGSRGESSTMARIDVEIMLLERAGFVVATSVGLPSTMILLPPGTVAVILMLFRHRGAVLRTTVTIKLVASMSVMSAYSVAEAMGPIL